MPYVYYNENDKHAAQWLRNLIAAGAIAPGEVDERDIQDVAPIDLRGFTQHHFFAGIGVWSYALRQAGWPDDRPVWTASCPCQPFSAAGGRGGFSDERHLWPALYWLVEICQPSVLIGEQVSSKDGLNWLDLVCADMEAAEYAVGALDTCAASVGAPHVRQRLYFVAHAESLGLPGRQDDEDTRRRQSPSGQGSAANDADPLRGCWQQADWVKCVDEQWRPVESGIEPLVDGSAFRLGSDGPLAGKSRTKMLRGYGNSIVAPLAIEFIKCVMECLP